MKIKDSDEMWYYSLMQKQKNSTVTQQNNFQNDSTPKIDRGSLCKLSHISLAEKKSHIAPW